MVELIRCFAVAVMFLEIREVYIGGFVCNTLGQTLPRLWIPHPCPDLGEQLIGRDLYVTAVLCLGVLDKTVDRFHYGRQ